MPNLIPTFTALLTLLLALSACGAPDEPSGSGGAPAASTTGAAGGSSTSGGAASSSSAGGSAGSCTVPGPAACGAAPPVGYPDPLLAYDPAAAVRSALIAAPGESPGGAALALLGPLAAPAQLAGVTVVLGSGLVSGFGCAVPAELRVALWTEPLCGLPAEGAGAHAVAVPTAGLTPEPVGDFGLRYEVPAPLSAPAGEGVFAAVVLTEPDLCVVDFESAAAGARSAWVGLVDADCDGAADAELGPAYLAEPTAPGIPPLPYDLGLGAYAAP